MAAILLQTVENVGNNSVKVTTIFITGQRSVYTGPLRDCPVPILNSKSKKNNNVKKNNNNNNQTNKNNKANANNSNKSRSANSKKQNNSKNSRRQKSRKTGVIGGLKKMLGAFFK